MARYRGPVEKIERRFGVSLGLKGERRLAGKSALDKRPYGPGQHGQRRTKISEYGTQLREKQKAKFMYGLSEKQMRSLFGEAKRRTGNTGTNLVMLLEQRLDNVVYRMGFATTRRFARQLVNQISTFQLEQTKPAHRPAMLVPTLYPPNTFAVDQKIFHQAQMLETVKWV